MKKSLASLIAGVLCFSLASCDYLNNYDITSTKDKSYIKKIHSEKKKIWNVDGEQIEMSYQGGFYSGKYIGIKRRLDIFSLYLAGKDLNAIEIFINWRFGDKKNYRINIPGKLEKNKVYSIPLENSENYETIDIYLK